MKKIIFILSFILITAPAAMAATLYSESSVKFSRNETRTLYPVTITATADSEITAENGIRLIIDAGVELLWDAKETLTATGSAVNNGKILATLNPSYNSAYKVLSIPVTADFASGESVTVSGITVRGYDKDYDAIYIKLDINGDNIGDFTDINSIEIDSNEERDETPPYPPTDISVAPNTSFTQVALSWQPSPDYDSLGTNIVRARTRGGLTQTTSLLFNSILTTYTDTDVMRGDMLTYTFNTSDGRNFSDPVVQTITLEASEPEVPVVPAPTPTPTPTADETLKTDLESKYGYFKLRYQIKCTPAGRTVSEGDAACLWAKIDLVYAQSLLARYDLSVALSARDKELIALRLPFSQKRYEMQCISAVEPAAYCTALGKALDRAGYLMEQ